MIHSLAAMASRSGSATSGADASAAPPSKPRLPSWVNKMPRNAFDEGVCKRRVEWSYKHGEYLPCTPAPGYAARRFYPCSQRVALLRVYPVVAISAARDFPARGHEEARVPKGIRQQSEHPMCQLSDGIGRGLPPPVEAGACVVVVQCPCRCLAYHPPPFLAALGN
eukprot:COSAG02_NODE_4320_length_5508_cov_5.227769_2_plen_166_part_00